MAEHGTPRRYRVGCRCDHCKRANTIKIRADRAKRMARGATPTTHGKVAYTNYGCRCQACTDANSARMQEYRQDPATGDRLRSNGRAYRATKQRASLDTATRYGEQWTGPEMELVCRDDLTYEELAVMLGRSMAAVSEKRKRLRRGDPVPVRLAGRPRT